MFDYQRDIQYIDRTERRIAAVTPHLQWMHLAQTIQEAYNDFKRDINNPSCQVTLFYHKFRQYEIQPGEPDHTPPCKSREKLEQTLFNVYK
jgi:hypothetical protein